TPHLSGQFSALSVSRVCSLIIEVQSFLGVMALTALVVAAVLEERKDAEEKIKRWNAELEVRVKERTAQLEMTNRELETFSYSVSHDLRAPLRSIGGFTQALREDADRHLSLQGRHYLDEVQSATHRMAQLIDDLLKLSRLQRSELKRNRVDISATVQHLCDTLQAQHPHRQIEWIIAPEVQANADGRLLENALENLLNNAVKFTAKHAHARIEFGVSKREEQVVYYVRDDGAGFNMNYVAKLFIPFQRLHLADEFEGNGVGLATVQRIVQRHGGNIWAEGAVEQGATFFFTLDGEK
ncbi:TPA: hypothetical protein DDW35_02910, partial [Candidatus Sumerlaeota bacterium]|nr:hypothetical protein [Candidatus Sumerlaeota bacterium]